VKIFLHEFKLTNSNPLLQQMMNSNPQLRTMLSNPNFLSQLSNPQTFNALMQMQSAMQQLQGTGLLGAFG
jgi:ubiquilin